MHVYQNQSYQTPNSNILKNKKKVQKQTFGCLVSFGGYCRQTKFQDYQQLHNQDMKGSKVRLFVS